MMRLWWTATFALASPLVSGPAHACAAIAPFNLDDIKYADVVVIGRIANYEIVRDHELRRKMLDNSALSRKMRKYYKDKNQYILSDYARFDVLVDQVLVGEVSSSFSVTWDNSTFGEPNAMAAGPFLIALRRPDSKMPPLRGASATILPNPEPGSLTILQAPCSGPFIFASVSDEARAVREILSARPR